ncbi:Crp/Fnr family transcriptional regulator [Flavobacterium sp. JAS]|uniref:Crp/Fnr family transcriptional regulator n=1 Tax=Flavobacterium sp. JAS TaxID=2897329 RepID=UPI001E64D941|nr:Crp/Fnr family transcriptional regulator [Flavobacterium sp. JAS]MCD0472461.1 Crp/Fnr family transcriptional regulator [Flavobacterium sp. JAS]
MIDFFSQFDFQSNLLFENLTESENQAIQNVMEPLSIKKGSMLFFEGGIPTGIYQIKSGKAKKFKRGFTGDEQIFYIYTQDDVLGYHALLGQERYQDSCEALEDSKVNFIAKEDFLTLLKEIPALQQTLIKNIGHEFGVLANLITVLAQKNQNARLALFLLLLENRFNRNSTIMKGIDLTRDDLANLIGTSQESLGRSLKQFKEQGCIEIDKRNIYIKDKKQLEQLLQVKID